MPRPSASGSSRSAGSANRRAWPRTISTDDFASIPEVEECHHVAGEADYLLKIRAADTLDLERVMRSVQAIEGVYTSETEIVFSTGFERRPLPLERETGDRTLERNRWRDRGPIRSRMRGSWPRSWLAQKTRSRRCMTFMPAPCMRLPRG